MLISLSLSFFLTMSVYHWNMSITAYLCIFLHLLLLCPSSSSLWLCVNFIVLITDRLMHLWRLSSWHVSSIDLIIPMSTGVGIYIVFITSRPMSGCFLSVIDLVSIDDCHRDIVLSIERQVRCPPESVIEPCVGLCLDCVFSHDIGLWFCINTMSFQDVCPPHRSHPATNCTDTTSF